MLEFFSSLNDYLSSCSIPNIVFLIIYFAFFYMCFVISRFCYKWGKSYDKLLLMYEEFLDSISESFEHVEVIEVTGKTSSDE